MKKGIWGIILIVIGIAAFLGSTVNGTFADFTNGIDIAGLTTIGLMIACVVGGIVLLIKKDP